MIVGDLKNVKAISLLPGEPPEELKNVIEEELKEIPGNALILTDLFGGTPSNVSSVFAKQGYQVLTGVNLPMLLETEMYRTNNMNNWEQVGDYITKIGKNSVININERLSAMKK
jgi:mannose/fructose-specific phosphotransferase system component IIA